MSFKAQAITYDFFVASAIFLVLILYLFIQWYRIEAEMYEDEVRKKMFSEAFKVSEIVLREGSPKYWNPQTVKEIGLSNNNQINETKLNFLTSMGYSKFGSLANLKFFTNISIEKLNGEKIFEFGPSVSLTPKELVKVKRFGILKGKPVKIIVYTWRV